MESGEFLLALMTSATVGVVATAGALGYMAWNRESTLLARLHTFVAPHIDHDDASDMDSRLENFMNRTPIGRLLLRDMLQSGFDVRPGRLMLYGLLGAGAAFIVAAVYKGHPNAGFVGAAAAIGLELALIRWRARKRWTRFRTQLPEALHVIASALAAGASLNQALQHGAREVPPPLQLELKRVVEDVEVGQTLEESLEALKRRVPLPEFDMIIASLLIQQRSGGNLAALLTETAELLKEDQRLRREMEVLTSQARASAQLIGLMPIGLFLYMYFFNYSFVEPLVTTSLGMTALGIAVVLEAIGFFVVYQIASYNDYQE